MTRKLTILIALSLFLAVPAGIAQEDDGPSEDATWGLCTAQDNYDDGDENSNGTVSSTPAFNDTSEEDCEDAEHPSNQSARDDRPEDDRGTDEDEDAGEEESSDQQPDDPDEAGDEESSDERPEDAEDSGEENSDDADR